MSNQIGIYENFIANLCDRNPPSSDIEKEADESDKESQNCHESNGKDDVLKIPKSNAEINYFQKCEFLLAEAESEQKLLNLAIANTNEIRAKVHAVEVEIDQLLEICENVLFVMQITKAFGKSRKS